MEDFITPEELASFMQLEVNLLPDSYELGISSACWAIGNYIGQELVYTPDDEEVRDGTGRPRMRLRQRPVRDISSILVDDEELDLDMVVLRDAVLTLTDGSVFTRGLSNVIITYSHGWDLDPADSSDGDPEDYLPFPSDIKLVALSAARRYMQRWGESGLEGEIMMEKLGDYEYTLHPDKRTHDHDLLRYETAVLDRYRVGLVP